MQAVACPDCILTRIEDTRVTQEITVVSAFHTVPNTTVPLICVSRMRKVIGRNTFQPSLSLSLSHTHPHTHTHLSLSLLGKAIVGQAIRQGRYVTYKRVEGVAVGRDRDDKDCRPQDPRQKPVERGPDGVQAGTVENRNGPAIRKQRQLRCACWYPRVSQSCTTKESPLVFFRASIVPEISICLFVNPCRHPSLLSRAFAYIRSDRTPRWGGEEEAVARDYSP